MCDCKECVQWQKKARGFIGNIQCTNSDHCICCASSRASCLHCNHHAVPITDSEQIHYHANVGRKNPCDYTVEDWVIVEKMKLLGLA